MILILFLYVTLIIKTNYAKQHANGEKGKMYPWDMDASLSTHFMMYFYLDEFAILYFI